MKQLTTALIASFLLLSCGGSDKKLRIGLPLPPKLDLADYDNLYFPGFITLSEPETFDAERETVNYLRREILRRNVMNVVARPPLDLSNRNPREFFVPDQPFFRNLSLQNPDRTLALTGEVAFQEVDRSGFKEVERIDITGRTYRQTQFVEMTGFNLDVRIFVYNMQGDLLYSQTLRDTTELEGINLDHHQVFLDLMARISERVMGLFSTTTVRAERSLM